MTMIRTFFTTLVRSSTSPRYYTDVVRAPFSFSLKFFIALEALIAFVLACVVSMFAWNFNLKQVVQNAGTVYPADLKLDVRGGKLAINKPLPYTVSVPVSWGESGKQPIPFIVFESDKKVRGINDVTAEQAPIVITESIVYLKKGEGSEIRALPFSSFEGSFSLTKKDIDGMVNRMFMHPFFAQKIYIPLIGSFAFGAGFVFLTVSTMIKILLFSLIIFVIVKIFMKKNALSYAKIYQVSLHAMTPFLLISVLEFSTKSHILVGPLAVVLLFVWVLYILSSIKVHDLPIKKLARVRKPRRR